MYTSDIKVSADTGRIYFYPNVVLVKRAEQSADDYVAINPILVVEVLSNSTRTYNAVDKYIQYRKLPSLQYYRLVEPETMLITCLTKKENGEWLSHNYTKPDAVVPLYKLGVGINMREIYGQ